MPSEYAQSQSQLSQKADLPNRRSTSSIHSQTDSPSTTPSPHKQKAHKHVVGRTHARVPSSKGLHKLTKAHGNNEGSHTDLKRLNRNASATSLKKNSSHVSLRRNRSSADIPKRPKSSQGQGQGQGQGQLERPTSVHFEIGDQDEGGWEEASSSASPVLSRPASRRSSHQSSAKPSADNSQPQSPIHSPSSKSPSVAATDGGRDERHTRPLLPATDAKVMTERLLQRTPSHNTTMMSRATATPTAGGSHSPDEMGKSQASTLNGTPQVGSKEDIVSRFVGGSGTPRESSTFLHTTKEPPKHTADEVKKSKSMGNLSRPGQHRDAQDDNDDDTTESALAPRSRKSSNMHAYHPPQQSRTQQKLWLQRASSNIEPQQMAPGAVNGLLPLPGMQAGLGLGGLVGGAGYDSARDPRIRIQLERTGLEYLVVRRHQDPVGQAMKRLGNLPGADRNRLILGQSPKKGDGSGTGVGTYGLSQSLRENRRVAAGGKEKSGARSSFDGGSQDDAGLSGRRHGDADNGEDGEDGDGGVGSLLRSLWEKSYDLSASAD